MAADNIKVVIKIRPRLPKELELPVIWIKAGTTEIKKEKERKGSEKVFDYVFDETDHINQIYMSCVQPLIEGCVEGFNGSVMAYGQTSSGKTHTMLGSSESPGLIQKAVMNIFNLIETNGRDRNYVVRCAYVEVYNEKIRDLLVDLEQFDETKSKIELKENPRDVKIFEKDGIVSLDAREEVATSADSIMEIIKFGNENKQVGQTAANERSSRSHTIFRIIIESSRDSESENESVKIGILDLVDLAGSEKPSDNKGVRFLEGVHINKSLSTLSQVIDGLITKKAYVNCRDSKLTRILQHSLGGNAKSLMICTVSPVEEAATENTLGFALRAKKVENRPHCNETLSDQALIRRLRLEIAALNNQIMQEKETRKMEIVEKIEMCERQFIRAKRPKNLKDRRRQTWAASLETNSNEHNDTDDTEALPQHTPVIFNMQRGSEPNLMHETPCFLPSTNFESPQYEVRTPVCMKPKLKTIQEDDSFLVAAQEFCDNCKYLMQEFTELQEFTKLEQILHTHDERQVTVEQCEDLIRTLDENLSQKCEELSKHEEISKLQAEEIKKLESELTVANAEKEKAVLSKKSTEEQFVSKEIELEAALRKLRVREKELIEELEERDAASKQQNFLERNSLLEDKLKASETQVFELQTAIEVYQKELETMSTSLKNATNDINLKRDLEKYKTKYLSLQPEYDEISSQLVDVLEENDKLKAESKQTIENLQMELSDTQSKLSEKMQAEQDLLMQLSTIREQYEKTDTELNETMKKHCEVEADLINTKDLLEQKEKWYSNVVNEVQALRDQLSQLLPIVGDKEKLDALNQALSKELSDSKVQMDLLKQEKQDILKENEKLKELVCEKEKLLDELNTKNEVVQELKLRIESLEKDNLVIKELKNQLEINNSQPKIESSNIIECNKSQETISEISQKIQDELNHIKKQLNESVFQRAQLEHNIDQLNQKLCSTEETLNKERELVLKLTEEMAVLQSDLQSKQNLVDSLYEIKKQLEHEKMTTEAQLAVYHSSGNENEKQLEESLKKVDEEKQAREETQRKLDEANTQISLLEESLNQIKEHQTMLEKELCSKNEEIDSLKLIIEQVRTDQKSNEELQSQLNNELAQLKDKLTETDSKLTSVENNLKAEQDSVKQLTQEKNTLQNDLLTKDALIESLNQNLSQLNCHKSNLEELLSSKESQYEQMKLEFEESLEKLDAQQSKQQESRIELEQAAAKISALETTLQNQEMIIQKLNATTEQLNSNQVDLEAEISAKNQLLDSLNENIELLSKEKLALEESLARYREDESAQTAQLRVKCDALQTKFDDLTLLLSSTEACLKEKRHLVAKLTEEKVSLQAELEQKSQATTFLNQENTDLQAIKGNLEIDIEKILNEKLEIENKLEVALKQSEKQIKLQEDLELQSRNYESLRTELEQNKNELISKQELIDSLTQKISDLQKEKSDLASQLFKHQGNQNEQVTKLTAEVNELKSLLTVNYEKISGMGVRVTDLEAVTEAQERKILQHIKKLEEEQALRRQLETNSEKLSKSISELEAEKSKLLQEMHSKVEAMDSTQRKSEELKAEIRELTLELKSIRLQMNEKEKRLQQYKQEKVEQEIHSKQMRLELDNLRMRTQLESSRKTRRQSAHDEWRTKATIGCQTDPTTEDCQCKELSDKIRRLQWQADKYKNGWDGKLAEIQGKNCKLARTIEKMKTENEHLQNETVRLRHQRDGLHAKLLEVREQKTSKSSIEKGTQTDKEETELTLIGPLKFSGIQKNLRDLETEKKDIEQKYNQLKTIARDRKNQLDSAEKYIEDLKKRVPGFDKENESNNVHFQKVEEENKALRKEMTELTERYKEYRQLYFSKIKKTSSTETTTQTDMTEIDVKNVLNERHIFEKKYKKICQLFVDLRLVYNKYTEKFEEQVTANRVFKEKLSKYEPDLEPLPPVHLLDPVYIEAYEKYSQKYLSLVNASSVTELENETGTETKT